MGDTDFGGEAQPHPTPNLNLVCTVRGALFSYDFHLLKYPAAGLVLPSRRVFVLAQEAFDDGAQFGASVRAGKPVLAGAPNGLGNTTSNLC